MNIWQFVALIGYSVLLALLGALLGTSCIMIGAMATWRPQRWLLDRAVTVFGAVVSIAGTLVVSCSFAMVFCGVLSLLPESCAKPFLGDENLLTLGLSMGFGLVPGVTLLVICHRYWKFWSKQC